MTTDPAAEARAVTILRVATTATFALALLLLRLMPARPVTTNTPGFTGAVIGFELASEPAHVFGILGAPDAPERPEAVRRMDLGNRIDYLFMAAYAGIYVGVTLFLVARRRIRGMIVSVLLLLSFLMFAGDALENWQLLKLSQLTDAAAMAGPLAALGVFTRLKWYAIYVASALVAPGIWRETGWWRWSALPFGLGGVMGAASLVYLPLIEEGANVVAIGWLMTLVLAWRR